MKSGKQVVAIDVMGGDAGASAMIAGIARAVKLFPKEIGDLILVGDSDQISKLVASWQSIFSKKNIEICHAEQTIDMTEKPMYALRYKKNSSMFKAISLLKDGEASGVLSCGNTGCLVAGGTLKLRMMPGVDRPALASIIPSPSNHFVLLDVGANPSTSPRSYVHNAILGSLYYKAAVNRNKEPRVGLLTIGTEEGKGSNVVKEAHEMLKKVNNEINYCGLIEGFQLFENDVDVVICDGFVGNILLKTMESLTATIKKYIKTELKKNPLRMFGAILSSGAFRAMKRDLTPDRYCGAPLLGLNGTVVKSHGSSSIEAIAHALLLTFRLSKLSSDHFLSDKIEKANALIE